MRDNTPSTAVAVTTSDSADLPGGMCISLFVNGPGTVNVLTGWSNTIAVSFTTTASNNVVPCKVRRVLATGTTATGIIALYN